MAAQLGVQMQWGYSPVPPQLAPVGWSPAVSLVSPGQQSHTPQGGPQQMLLSPPQPSFTILQGSRQQTPTGAPLSPLSPVSVSSNDGISMQNAMAQQLAMQMQMMQLQQQQQQQHQAHQQQQQQQQQAVQVGHLSIPQLQLPEKMAAVRQEQEDHFAKISFKQRGSPLSPATASTGFGKSPRFSEESEDGLSGKSGRPQKPWITPALIEIIGAKKNNYKQYAANPGDTDAKKMHVDARKAAMKAVRKAKREYLRKQGLAQEKERGSGQTGKPDEDAPCPITSPEGLTSSTTSLASHFSSFGVEGAGLDITPVPSSNLLALHHDSPTCPPLDEYDDEDEDDTPPLGEFDLDLLDDEE